MKNHTYFHHSHLRKLIVAFGSMFDDLAVARRDQDGKLLQVIHPVPIEYAPRDKFLARLQKQETDDEDLSDRFHEVYPRMAFEMISIDYAPGRELSPNHRHMERRGEKVVPVATPTPYDVGFTLSIAGRTSSDVHQIFEQIAPSFRPYHVVAVKDDPAGGHLDVPFYMAGNSWEDEYQGEVSESIRRVVMDVSFVAQYRMLGQAASPDSEEVVAAINKDSALKERIAKVRVRNHSNAYGYYSEENADHVQEISGSDT